MVAHPQETTRRPSPLIITADPLLLEELLRLTADVGLIADVAPDPAAARSWFPAAPLVFIGRDMAEACIRAGFRSRPDVILIDLRDRGSNEEKPVADIEIAERLGADHVAFLPAGEPWLVARLSRWEEGQIADVIGVLGGRGGAGASVLAGGLAVTGARQGRSTMLIDADPLGGGVDLVMGWEHRDGLRWPALSGAGGNAHPSTLLDALPGQSDLVVLSWDRGEPTSASPDAMAVALDAGRHDRDLVIVDLPRSIDDASALALTVADRTYLVVPAELRACAAAARVAATVISLCPDLQVVVRRPAPGRLTPVEVADAVGLPLAGSFDLETSITNALERGEPPTGNGRGSLAKLCERLLAAGAVEIDRDAA